jgi:hypothetical protein
MRAVQAAKQRVSKNGHGLAITEVWIEFPFLERQENLR